MATIKEKPSKWNIEIVRGDSFRCPIEIYFNGELYEPGPDDKIQFALKKNFEDDLPILTAEVPTDTMILELTPLDTKRLDNDEDYVYDIQIRFSDGYVKTFIAGTFTTTAEVL